MAGNMSRAAASARRRRTQRRGRTLRGSGQPLPALIQGVDLPISIGMKQRDVARGPMPRKVPAANRLVSVYCGPHGKKGRRLNAVVTKQGRLLTTVEDVSYVDPGDDRVMAPCDLCPMHREPPNAHAGLDRHLQLHGVGPQVRRHLLPRRAAARAGREGPARQAAEPARGEQAQAVPAVQPALADRSGVDDEHVLDAEAAQPVRSREPRLPR